MSKKILIITPKFPYPSYGACEQDRAAGIEFFVKAGYEVQVITKVYADSYKEEALAVGERLGIKVIPISYKFLYTSSTTHKIGRFFGQLFRPWYLDGAAYEYTEPEIRQVLMDVLESFHPDVVWFDYTYLWPLYKIVKKKGIPIITRSINFEPKHFLEEDGRKLVNYIKFLPKLFSEYIVSRQSDVLCAITPDEAKMYQRLGAHQVFTLPLRGLPYCAENKYQINHRQPLNVFFSGSTYNVIHNRRALEFLLTQVIPETEKQFSNQFMFHIFGGKIPESFSKYFNKNVLVHNYLPKEEFEEIMSAMDIAVTPSLYGAGMQQKIFEPLTRGVPTVTSARGLAGYPFQDDKHLLLAKGVQDFVCRLDTLRDPQLRLKLSRASYSLASDLFSPASIEKILDKILKSAKSSPISI